jgi:hypothetical protein
LDVGRKGLGKGKERGGRRKRGRKVCVCVSLLHVIDRVQGEYRVRGRREEGKKKVFLL